MASTDLRPRRFRGPTRLDGGLRAVAVSLLLCLCISSTGCITVDMLGAGRGPLRETRVQGKRGPKILLLDITGVITERPRTTVLGFGAESTVALAREALEKARRDSKIEALLLRIDSPGGSATASEILYQELMRFKQETDLPVVAQLMGTATSGGYYVAMSADEVVAHPTTVTGSIGVIFLSIELSGLMQKLGIANQTLTGGDHKDAGSPLRPITRSERAHLQAVIDDLHTRFETVVDAGRPGLDRGQVEELADGSIYSASQATANGLVDRIGTIDDSIEALMQRTGNAEMRVVRYTKPREYKPTVYNRAPPSAPVLQVDLRSLLGPFDQPGFHYLWMPGGF